MKEENKNYFNNDFSYEIWNTTYKTKNERSIDETWDRVAKSIASVEHDKDKKIYLENVFYNNLLKDFKFVPGGRILANAGREVNATLINCFTSPKPEHDIDSLNGIMNILKDQANTLKSEGGWGLNFSFIRPRGSYIHGIGVRTPGSVKYMELFDKSSEIITEGPGEYSLEFNDHHDNEKKKIRKGAMMSLLSIYHPDIEEFITAKQTPGRLTKMNMSVAMSDSFMEKLNRVNYLKSINAPKDEIEDADKWHLIFPDTTYPKYKDEWDGNFEKWIIKKYPVNVYKTVKLTQLWDLIMSSTYNRAEPGILFIDRANKTFAANYIDDLYIDSCNPCLAGSTKVAVADGRKNVTIKELALEGRDIPVFAHDYNNKLIVKMMRRPRLTGYMKPIYRITFNDNNYVDCTDNHKLELNDGSFKEVKDLAVGDILYSDVLSKDDYSVKSNSFQPEKKLCVFSKLKMFIRKLFFIFKTNVLKFWNYIKLMPNEDISFTNYDFLDIYLKRQIDICRTYVIAKEQGYDAIISDDNVMVKKTCEFCGKEFYAPYSSREIAYCSVNCSNSELYVKPLQMNTYDRYRLMFVFNKLKQRLERVPTESEFLKECYVYNCKITFGYNSTFYSYNQLLHYSKCIEKYTVKDIQYIGLQNVYTGTVDDVHNYCIGLFETSDSDGTEYVSMLNNMQCGEQMLPKSGCCNLGSINLTKFVTFKNGIPTFDFCSFADIVPIAVNFLDNVLDIANLPLDSYKEFAESYRRIGLGIMGLGSTLVMLGIRYGSDESIEFIHKILNILNKKAIIASIELGNKKGSYRNCDWKKHLDNVLNFYPNLDEDSKKEIKDAAYKYKSFRHTALFSIQPTGNTGCLANNVSGGIEPIFSLEYNRIANVPNIPESLKSKCPKFWEGEFEENNFFKNAISDSKDKYLKYEDENGITYLITKDRGLCKYQKIIDFSKNYIDNPTYKSFYEEHKDAIVTAVDLNVHEHLRVLDACAQHIDSAISKTVNIKNNYPFNAFKDIYMEAYKGGYIKGVTTYRDGSMLGVLSRDSDMKNNQNSSSIHKTDAIKRPKELPCKLHLLTIRGISYYVIVGFLGDDPYEIFMGENLEDVVDYDGEIIGKKVIFKSNMNGISAKFIKKGNRQYVFETPSGFSCLISRKNESDEKATITGYSRILSCALRHGAPIKYLVEQMEKTEGSMVSPLKVITKVLKKYIKDTENVKEELCPNCKSKLVRKEGCKSCPTCGWSACG